MYIKLAKRNMERSLKDYTIYFLTLVFGVCIFYAFNSIGSQKIMMKLSEYEARNFQKIDELMAVISIFISCILGFLIIYANSYIIKRRKKEFGIYLTLGMENKEISNILLTETILIGIFSLGLGLLLGVFLSQGMSIFTAKLFHVELTSFRFTFSNRAFVKTIVYFVVIYLIVFLFNTISITRLELIDLLTDGRKNEKVKVKSLKTSMIIFIISIILIAAAYFIILSSSLRIIFADKTIVIPITLAVIGTFLFFFSLSGFLLRLVQNSKRVYLKELNMFILRQINSRINTTFVSMSFVCLMIFISICMLAGGFSISKTLNKNIDDLPPYDAAIFYIGKLPINEFLNKNINLSYYTEDYVTYYDYYNKNQAENLGIKTYLGKEEGEKNNSNVEVARDSVIKIMKLSDFNSLMKFYKKEGITLNKGEYAAFGDIKELLPSIQKAMDKKTKIKVGGQELIPSKKPFMYLTIDYLPDKKNFCTFIVRDELSYGLTSGLGYLNLNFNGDKAKTEKEFLKVVKALDDNKKDEITCICNTRKKIEANVFGMAGMVSYLALYIGLIFLIISAVILSLQQLSHSADNIERYKLLKKMGVDEDMLNKTIFMQTAIYFVVPLFLALIHSIVGLMIAKVIVNYFGAVNVTVQILITTFIFIIIYGGYFWITYIGARKMVK
ncbi:FtsX-like permease family protein [Clostridium sp. OS1-26]|uniref:FtsX-like permease family protein n=1 Tax=Clostridium sp. OS1-26 TaxID=3070681 RepID=UPI0027DF3BD2|nr:FtsX-like permease family protein [Clostridium sp. OS1-26]WML34251.1 FtsX-like permease family protein [Clostridium sp. OS1-26]